MRAPHTSFAPKDNARVTAYFLLWLSAFAAATLLPMQSEAALAVLLMGQEHSGWLLLVVATSGNVLGSAVNAWLGRQIDRFQSRRWFPVSPQALEKARERYARYGCWSLLLSWLPLIGDPLTLVAGLMREPWWRFFLLVTVAKGGRYLFLAWFVGMFNA